MTIYPLMLPLFAATALAGLLLGRAYWRSAGMPGWAGALVGGVAGAAGPLMTMYPLESCTFEPGRGAADWAVGGLAFVLGAGVLIGLALWVGRALASPGGLRNLDGGQSSGMWRGSSWTPLILLTPTVVILAVFLYLPLATTFKMSVHKVFPMAVREPFVCTDNYTMLFSPSLEWWALLPVGLFAAVSVVVAVVGKGETYSTVVASTPLLWLRRSRGVLALASAVTLIASSFDAEYRRVFFNTLFFTSATTVVALAAGLAIALLVWKPIRGQGLYRTFMIWPYAISPPIAGILFFVIFDPTTGMFGHLWEMVTGLDVPPFRSNEWLARALIVLASVWKTVGYTIIFYLAGLQNVSQEMLEAASLDGAGPWTRFRRFILPSLAPITFFLVITTVTYSFFQIFGTIDYMTRGGPSGTTTDAMYSIIEITRNQGSWGEAAAQSLLLFAMVLAVTAWQFRSTGRRITYGN